MSKIFKHGLKLLLKMLVVVFLEFFLGEFFFFILAQRLKVKQLNTIFDFGHDFKRGCKKLIVFYNLFVISFFRNE